MMDVLSEHADVAMLGDDPKTKNLKPGPKSDQPGPLRLQLGGGRSWWAHLDFTRINIELTILRKKFEEQLSSPREQ